MKGYVVHFIKLEIESNMRLLGMIWTHRAHVSRAVKWGAIPSVFQTGG